MKESSSQESGIPTHWPAVIWVPDQKEPTTTPHPAPALYGPKVEPEAEGSDWGPCCAFQLTSRPGTISCLVQCPGDQVRDTHHEHLGL